MIEDVEEIRSCLERDPLGKSELPAQRHVPLSSAESTQSIASEISLSGSGSAEGRRVDDFASGCVRLVEIERNFGNYIRALYTVRSRQDTAEGIFPRDHIHG